VVAGTRRRRRTRRRSSVGITGRGWRKEKSLPSFIFGFVFEREEGVWEGFIRAR